MAITPSLLATRLVRLQIGQESTWGTQVPATAVWMGIAPVPKITPNIATTPYDEQRGSLHPSYVAPVLKQGGAFDLSGATTYEDICYLLAMAYGLGSNPVAASLQTLTITGNTIANPTVVTVSAAHGLTTGQDVTITSSNSTPPINGNFPITTVAGQPAKFTVPVNCSGTGSAGTVSLVGGETITIISKANPAVITTGTVAHQFNNGDLVYISGSNSSPVIDGWRTVANATTYTFTCGVDTSAGSAGSAGTVWRPAKWSFSSPGDSAWSPSALTMELGESETTSGIVGLGGLLQGWSLTGSSSKEIGFTAKGFFQSCLTTPTALTSLTSVNAQTRLVEQILFPQTTLAMDVAGATPGTTAVAGRLTNYTLDCDTGLTANYTGGSLTPTSWAENKTKADLKLGVLLDASTFGTWLSNNPAKGLGMVVELTASSGYKRLVIDYAGVLSADPVYFDDDQGNRLLSLQLSARVDTGPIAGILNATVYNAMPVLL